MSPSKGVASIMKAVNASAYAQHSVKHKTVNSVQTDSFIKKNESNVPVFFHCVADVVEISQDAKDVLNNGLLEPDKDKTTESKDKMAEWKEKMEEMRREMNWLRDELKRAGEVAEGMGEAMRVMIKCLRISMRIMSGHNVPNADHRFLMENDSALYSKAITMRMEITDPEDLERLSEDEEENNEESTGVEAPPISSTDTSPEASGENSNTDTVVDIVA